MRNPPVKGDQRAGFPISKGTHHGARPKHRKMTVALSRNLVGSVPDRHHPTADTMTGVNARAFLRGFRSSTAGP
jgi:hypothetical protein